MIDQVRLIGVLSDFASHLVGSYDVEAILDTLCEGVVAVLPVTGAGVMLEDDAGVLRFVASSDDLVREIERLQIDLGEGPCLHAARTGEPVVVDDLRSTSWFPQFAPQAVALGMAAVYSFPMRVDDACVGAINLYRDEPGQWDEEASTTGRLLADVATGYVLNARAFADSTRLASQLQHALTSRVVIEQAKGKVSALANLDVDKSFELLRRHARSHGRKLVEVAEAVMAGDLSVEELRGG